MSQPFSAWQRGLRQPNLLVGMLLSSCLLLCAHCIEILCAHASGCRCHIHAHKACHRTICIAGCRAHRIALSTD